MIRISNRKKHNVSENQIIKMYEECLDGINLSGGVIAKSVEQYFYTKDTWLACTLEDGRAVFYVVKMSEYQKIKPSINAQEINSQSVYKAIVMGLNRSKNKNEAIKYLTGEFSNLYTATINGYTY